MSADGKKPGCAWITVVAVMVGVTFGTGIFFGSMSGFDRGYEKAKEDAAATVMQPDVIDVTNAIMRASTGAYVLRTYNDPRFAVSVSKLGIFFEPAPASKGSVVGTLYIVPADRTDGPWMLDAVKLDATTHRLSVARVGGETMLAITYPEM